MPSARNSDGVASEKASLGYDNSATAMGVVISNATLETSALFQRGSVDAEVQIAAGTLFFTANHTVYIICIPP